ncbi:MAG: hypothetical protein DRP83_00215 [Planctomycetota bacterium]|nr:MAG: hypothetical protein DRP83_00215 [Planctomycetota bacterium]
MSESGVFYVTADDAQQARIKTYEDINEIMDCYGDWEFDEIMSDMADIDAIKEIGSLPESYEIPAELCFETPPKDGDVFMPVDPRQLKLFTR